MLVYDVTLSKSFENIPKWKAELEEMEPECVILLVGNKCDRKNDRMISTEEGKEFARKHSLYFLETSAIENINVTEAFTMLLQGKFYGINVLEIYSAQKNKKIKENRENGKNQDTIVSPGNVPAQSQGDRLKCSCK